MRTLQLMGFLITVSASIFGYLLLSQIEVDTTASAAGGVGFALLFLVAPALGLSAVMLVSSSIALIWPAVRERTYFQGAFWCGLWAVNSIICTGYLFVAAYMTYVWFSVSAVA